MLKGLSAHKGIVRGTVKTVRHTDDFLVLEEECAGKILVFEAITPDKIVYCFRASGLVAQTGGITSHAAIIARELNIPCLVSCRHALEVLKDGQTVILNADEGYVDEL